MADVWYYAEGEARRGPVDSAAIRRLVEQGALARDAQAWREGVEAPVPAGVVAELTATSDAPAGRGLLAGLGAKLSQVARVPEIGDVPVGHVLSGGLAGGGGASAEEVFAVGTPSTTPPLAEVRAGWPRPRVWWRILVGATLAWLLLRIGLDEFDNPLMLPGLIVTGAFMVPLAVVVFFFELNVPRNVSVYQVGKLLLFGGALALAATMILAELVPASGVNDLLPSMLTGVVEETGKALALLIVVRRARWPWQLNGLLFGAAVGAGFAGFESAGYAMAAGAGFEHSIFWRALLSPGGHVIWTAMVGAALWQVRGTRPFRLDMLRHPVVVRRWLVAVVLHGLWDANVLGPSWWLLQCLALLVIGWYLVLAIAKQGLAEVAEAQRQAAAVPVAPPAGAT